MTAWIERPIEERRLLNPAFCSLLIWTSCRRVESDFVPLSIEESFLILPFILPQSIRAKLPLTLKTPLSTWLSDHPELHQKLPNLAKLLTPFTRSALGFGGQTNLLSFHGNSIDGNPDFSKKTRKYFKNTSDEVIHCVSKAEFLGKWFAKAGDPSTTLALIGVRP